MKNLFREFKIVNVEFGNILNNGDVLINLNLSVELVSSLEDSVINRDVSCVLEVVLISELVGNEWLHVWVSVSGRVGKVGNFLLLLNWLDRSNWLRLDSLRLDSLRLGRSNRFSRNRLGRGNRLNRSRLSGLGRLGNRSGGRSLRSNRISWSSRASRSGRSGLRSSSGTSGSRSSRSGRASRSLRSRSHGVLGSHRSSRLSDMVVLSSLLDLVGN